MNLSRPFLLVNRPGKAFLLIKKSLIQLLKSESRYDVVLSIGIVRKKIQKKSILVQYLVIVFLLFLSLSVLQVRKRPLNKKEIAKREEDIISIHTNSLVVHETKLKVGS